MKLPSFFNISMLAFVISVFSLSFLSLGLQLNSTSQILGETTSRVAAGGIVAQPPQVPCNDLNVLANQFNLIQNKYCSKAPKPTTYTNTPTPATPTPVLCKTGVNDFSVSGECPSGYLYARVKCYDGFSITQGNGTMCYSSEIWYELAQKVCSNRSSCIVNPTSGPTGGIYRATPTPAAYYPTIPPYYGPTPTPAYYPTSVPQYPTTAYLSPVPTRVPQPPIYGTDPPYGGR